jgi:hypothetical protein
MGWGKSSKTFIGSLRHKRRHKDINNYQILTPSGWSDFDGVHTHETDILFVIKFSDGTETKSTENHLFKFPNGEFLEACHIMVGDVLWGNKKVEEISYIHGDVKVYGITNVHLNNEYISDGVVSHNCAFIESAEEIWLSAQSTLSTGGSAILLSTPNGVGNFFHKMWMDAENDVNGFNTVKLHWSVHPERDIRWRDEQTRLLGTKGAAQECDVSFVSSGDNVIDPEILLFYKETHIEEPREKRGIDGNLWVWEYPNTSDTYIVCADVSRGDASDYSTAQVIDIVNLTQVAEYKGKIDTKDFGNFLVSLATEYNDALLVIENSNVGWATLQQCIDRNYGNLFYMSKDLRYVDTQRQMSNKINAAERQLVAGFSTTTRTRPLIISKLDEYLSSKSIIIKSNRLIDELFVFIWKNSKAQAMQGYNDDLVMSFAISLWVRDTAIRLRQEGVNITQKALDGISASYLQFYNPKNTVDDPYKIQVGDNEEDIRWLF